MLLWSKNPSIIAVFLSKRKYLMKSIYDAIFSEMLTHSKEEKIFEYNTNLIRVFFPKLIKNRYTDEKN